MPDQSSSLSESEIALYTGCGQLLAHLSELAAFHLTIDTPERAASVAEPVNSLRLRKAYFHIQAVISWPIDAHIVHVMGPDIRTAQRHLEPIATDFRDSVPNPDQTSTSSSGRDATRRLLNAVSHPTPVTLIHPNQLGGLGPTEPIAWLPLLFVLLGGLADDYAAALCALTDTLGGHDAPELVDIMARTTTAIASIPPSQILASIDLSEVSQD